MDPAQFDIIQTGVSFQVHFFFDFFGYFNPLEIVGLINVYIDIDGGRDDNSQVFPVELWGFFFAHSFSCKFLGHGVSQGVFTSLNYASFR